MKEICLYSLEQAGVIVLQKTGVVYFNQVGGKKRTQARAEGLFVPISNDPPLDSLELALPNRLRDLTKHCVGLTPQVAIEINAILREVSSTDGYQVNMDKLAESQEAWLHVRISPQGEYSNFGGFDTFDGILTWPIGE